MPDHFHGLLSIYHHGSQSQPVQEPFGRPVRGSLPTIVRAYKSAVTAEINRQKGEPGSPVWQRNDYERVIRGETELREIETYILNNPYRK
jgi:REP element-mobilizing transposase RayT